MTFNNFIGVIFCFTILTSQSFSKVQDFCSSKERSAVVSAAWKSICDRRNISTNGNANETKVNIIKQQNLDFKHRHENNSHISNNTNNKQATEIKYSKIYLLKKSFEVLGKLSKEDFLEFTNLSLQLFIENSENILNILKEFIPFIDEILKSIRISKYVFLIVISIYFLLKIIKISLKFTCCKRCCCGVRRNIK